MDRAIREKETRGEVELGATATLLDNAEYPRESSTIISSGSHNARETIARDGKR